jgi:hypothetical protein
VKLQEYGQLFLKFLPSLPVFAPPSLPHIDGLISLSSAVSSLQKVSLLRLLGKF